MREIEFRGLNINGEWLYGNLAIIPFTIEFPPLEAGSYISNKRGVPFACRVRPETVGQFVGLLDENGKEIYEGDIFDPHIKGFGPCVVRFNKGAFVFEEDGGQHNLGPIHSTVEVIGNIHENRSY